MGLRRELLIGVRWAEVDVECESPGAIGGDLRRPTIEGVRAGRDEVLEAAADYLDRTLGDQE
ncbi:MAG: hypothetical protein WDA27_07700 [Actinomycetota bacterium]